MLRASKTWMTAAVCLAAYGLWIVYGLAERDRILETFSSGPDPVLLVESYTSEGCSSCPAADAWISGLADSDGLWRRFIPVAFHVDFWDGLGWPDPFASPAHSNRLRMYVRQWNERNVVTPTVAVAGRHDRAWLRQKEPEPAVSRDAGILTLKTHSTRRVTVEYRPPKGMDRTAWTAHAALLGVGLERDIGHGENRGRTLRHDFVALSHAGNAMRVKSGETVAATLELPVPDVPLPDRMAVAAWVTHKGRPEPMQAVGGPLGR